MNERAYDIWVYDQERPNEECSWEGRLNIPKPTFLYVPDKRNEEEKEKANDQYLKSKGV